MTLVKYKSAPRQVGVDRLASEIFGSNSSRLFGNDGSSDHIPRVNIVEGSDDFRREMQARGFDKKDLKLEMVDDTLTIRDEHTEEQQQTDDVRWTATSSAARPTSAAS